MTEIARIGNYALTMIRMYDSIDIEREVNKMKSYNLYYNQKVTLIPAESFFAVYWSQKSWYNKGTVLFIEDTDTGELRKFVVE